MSSFKLTQLAKMDLRSIAKFTEARWSKSQRDIYVKQLNEVFFQLSQEPLIGKPCGFIRKGYFKFPQGSHIVFYKIMAPKEILIIRILHKKMDVSSVFEH